MLIAMSKKKLINSQNISRERITNQWDTFQETKISNISANQLLNSSLVNLDVPEYNQDKFGDNTCTPTAILEILAYWDSHGNNNNGYENVIDYTTANSNITSGVKEAIEDIKKSILWTPLLGTFDPFVCNGIKSFCNSSEYKNNLNFESNYISNPSFDGRH